MTSDQETRPRIGAAAKDLSTDKIGFVMGEQHGMVQLRPLSGGVEWEVTPDQVVTPTAEEVLSARVAVENGRKRWGL
ncbi:hypothetical protein [Streptomyces sp. NPDC058486]|uniref:hypothetical protein n=1 Tax=unclassified Streptomyces TaxID=2593676 RepID=UPI00365189D5